MKNPQGLVLVTSQEFHGMIGEGTHTNTVNIVMKPLKKHLIGARVNILKIPEDKRVIQC